MKGFFRMIESELISNGRIIPLYCSMKMKGRKVSDDNDDDPSEQMIGVSIDQG